jgi:hypothetical protein
MAKTDKLDKILAELEELKRRMPVYVPYVQPIQFVDNRPACCRGCSNWGKPWWCTLPYQNNTTTAGSYSYTLGYCTTQGNTQRNCGTTYKRG